MPWHRLYLAAWPRRTLGLGLALALVGASVGIVGAAIPQTGVYIGCNNKTSGALRVIDAAVASQKCASSDRLITWNQTGPPDAHGQDGQDGADAILPDFLGPQIWKIRFEDDGDADTEPSGASAMDLPAGTIHYDHQNSIDSFDGDISQCTRAFGITFPQYRTG